MLSALGRARRRLPLGVRADVIELLDGDCLTGSEIEVNLDDLARLNRLPGGTAASVAAIARVAEEGRSLRVLDVGTGAADMPLAFARHGWHTVAVDTNPSVLEIARRRTGAPHGVEIIAGDARSLPFADASFDVAHCSLLIHHLRPDEAVVALDELRRVARRGIVINDLRRGWLPLLAIAATVAALGRCRTTRHDGLASARRAYTLDELDELIGRAGLAVRWRSPAWLPRVATLATVASAER